MKNIAIIGSGISGLTAAYLLNKMHKVTVFEKNDYIGGHTATIDIHHKGRQYAIDTGFIVFNDRTYPNFTRLLSAIGIDRQATEMSFSVQNSNSGLEYNGQDLNTLFAQRRNLFNPRFWSLLKQIVRFNKSCKRLYREPDHIPDMSLGDFLVERGFSAYFSYHYILPMAAAIWSSSLNQAKGMELKFFIRFFYNHGLLDITNRPQWYVIPGGSKQYIPPLIKEFASDIQLNAQIQHVIRHQDGVAIQFSDGTEQAFDDVVFACHSDQALELLHAPTDAEREVLSGLPYVDNEVVLHTDTQMLPKRKLAWASWNYRLDINQDRLASVTYNMNILQGIASDTTFCVTLNQTDAIDPDQILKRFTYAHPVLSQQAQAFQNRRDEICGVGRCHFAGAYWYNGFHEDGVRSAIDVAARFGCAL